MTTKLTQPTKNMSIAIRGYDGERYYSSSTEISFEKDKAYGTTIDLKKVRKAFDLIADSENGFEVYIRGYGEDVENHDSRYTSLYKAYVSTEKYKGMTLYSMRLNDNYDYNSHIAYPTANDAIKAIMQEVTRLYTAQTLEYDYKNNAPEPAETIL